VAAEGTSRTAKARAILAQLAERWPAAFVPPRPFKIGIDQNILTALPETNPRLLSLALALHCQQTAYVTLVLQPGSVRVDLSGEPVGVVTSEEVERHMAHRREEAERKRRRYEAMQQEQAALERKAVATG
jgi:sRNA-binding protein